jgi:hypothetical protein
VRAAFLCIALAAPVLAATPARADIFAVAPVAAPGRTDVDVGLFNVSTGAQLALPAGVNTPAEENHPSISGDGRRLAFERRDGADRIIVADLTTAQMGDVYDAFDAATKQPTSPAISGDGKTVVTGSRSQGVFWTPLSAFPNPPEQRFGEAFFQGSPVLDPTPTNGTPGSLIAFRVSTRTAAGGSLGRVMVAGIAEQAAPLALVAGNVQTAHPAIGRPPGGGLTILYDRQGDIGFCLYLVDGNEPCSSGRGILPPVVNSPRTESRAAFTPDGRFIGFIRDEAGGHERLYLFDTQTQTLLDPGGIDLGAVQAADAGNLSLYQALVIQLASIRPGTLSLTLSDPSRVGLLVQRVVGHHRLLGRRVPTLEPAGRIPLGTFGRGRHTVHWRTHGLRPGVYQFTARALTANGRVRDIGRPRLLRIR